MKNIIVKILFGLLVIGLLVLLILKSTAEERPFNQIELSGYNTIQNGTFPTYYDTVLSVAMDQMGLSGYVVTFGELSDGAKSQFDGDLKAHVRYFNSNFYLFTQNMTRDNTIEVLCHEVIHMQQYTSGDLVYDDGNVTWKGETLELNSKEYEMRPWENDAFNRQSELIKSVERVLYSDN